MTTHFGVKPYNKIGGFKLTVDNYINVSIKEISSLSNEELEDQKKKVRDKYNLNMKFFESLSREDFNQELNKLIGENNFTEIKDLTSVSGVSGFYIMILDEYCLMYIGIARNIKGRIMEHWSKQVPLRQLFLGVESGGLLPIDCFRALDTTRIFVCRGNEDDYSEDNIINMMYEDRLIYKFPVDYCLNIATFWGSREIRLERLRNFELRDLKIYGKSHLTTMLERINQRSKKKS